VAEPATIEAEPEIGEPDARGKSERTRSAIIDAALTLFRERGYDATTMRAIAAEAGVSVGNAYYYFSSKEQLVQGFYDRAQADHAEAARPVLEAETDLTARMIGVLEAWLRTIEPYKPFAGKFFKNAAEPTSPLSPFSPESAPARATAIDLWREVLDGSMAKIPKKLRPELPELLWLYFMGIVLFWVHDPTEGTVATRAVIHRTVPLIVRAIGLARLPTMRNMLDDVVGLISDIRQIFPAPPE
jgi:AcrR family transcriptional regulator